MALVVCCPCGNPLDCDHLELVVTLNCPQCDRELSIEVQHPKFQRCYGVLTVLEGPYWVGEQFVLPVGEELVLGRGGEKWLSLESDELSDAHCKLLLQPTGQVVVQDTGSQNGTWIGDARILKGKLMPQDSLRVGDYRLRLDFRAAIGGESAVTKAAVLEHSGELPMLRRVQSKSASGWLLKNRFRISRYFIIAFAWLSGIFHACSLHWRQDRPAIAWKLHWSIIGGAVVLTLVSLCGRRFAMVHRFLKFAVLAVLIILAVSDVIWVLQAGAIAALILAAGLALLIPQTGKSAFAFLGTLMGLIAIVVMLVAAIRSVSLVSFHG